MLNTRIAVPGSFKIPALKQLRQCAQGMVEVLAVQLGA